MKSKIKDSVQEYRQLIAILGILVFLVIFFSIIAKGFFTYNNFINLLRQLSMLGIVSTGMAMVLISGGLDLTVGSQMSLIGTVTALLIVKLLYVSKISVESFGSSCYRYGRSSPVWIC